VFGIAARAPLAVEHALANAASAVEVDGGARERIPEAAFDDERNLLSIERADVRGAECRPGGQPLMDATGTIRNARWEVVHAAQECHELLLGL